MEPRRRRVVPAPAACSVSNYCRSQAKSAAATLPFTDSSGVGLHCALTKLPTAAPWRAIRWSCLPAGRLRRSTPSSPPRPPLVSFPLRFPFHVVVLPVGHWFRLAVRGALRDVVLRGARAAGSVPGRLSLGPTAHLCRSPPRAPSGCPRWPRRCAGRWARVAAVRCRALTALCPAPPAHQAPSDLRSLPSDPAPGSPPTALRRASFHPPSAARRGCHRGGAAGAGLDGGGASVGHGGGGGNGNALLCSLSLSLSLSLWG
jgi:hypothetical protein